MIDGEVRCTINGVEVEGLRRVSIREQAPPPAPVTPPVRFEFNITVRHDDRGLLDALLALAMPRTRYWARRRQHAVARWRRRCARRLGVSYQAFRRYCRTGEWS